MRAPSGLTDSDSEEEDGDVVTSRPHHKGRSPSPGITTNSSNLTMPGLNDITSTRRSPSPAQVALAEVTQQFQAILTLRTRRRVADLEAQLAQADLEESQALSLLASERQGRQRAFAMETETALQKQKVSREQLLANIRIKHKQQQQEAISKAEQLEEALQQKRQQEEDRLRRAAEEEKAAAAAKKQMEEKALRQAEERKQALLVSKQAQEEKARTPLVKIAPSAAEEEQRLSQLLKAAQEAVAPFVGDKAMRDRKRAIDKYITLNVQQISATIDQVRAKVSALSGFIAQQPQGPLRTYSMLTLASKLISQCEVQITRLHSFAFPLAEVAVGVGVAHPEFIAMLIARLNSVCPLTVPKHLGYRPGSNEDEYLRAVGYRIIIDDDDGEVEKESTDDFIARCQGYLLLYAAMTQSDVPANPLGLGSAWAYLARTINALPATRLTAVAVESFMKVAGFKLAAVYKGQFLKLLQVLDSSFLGELSGSGDADARAVYTRIQTYLKMSGWTKQPEGRQMPQRDASSYNRA